MQQNQRDLNYMDGLSSSTGATTEDPAYLSVQRNGGRNSQRTRVFDFHSGRKCPTCAGTGKIPKGQDDELVALIPYSDKRLKPRRTWISILFVVVSICLVVLLVIGGILVAFMFPRDVSVSLTNATQYGSHIKLKGNFTGQNIDDYISSLTLNIKSSISISNTNFFKISISQINITVSHLDTVISAYSANGSFSISSRSNNEGWDEGQNLTFEACPKDIPKVRTF